MKKKTKVTAFIKPSDELYNNLMRKKIPIGIIRKLIREELLNEISRKKYKIVGKIRYCWDYKSMECAIYKGIANVVKL